MKLAIACCLLVVLVSVGCRKKKPVSAEVSSTEVAPANTAGGEPNGASRSAATAQASQAVPTLKGVGPNSDNPLAKALAGSDPQAHLRALNELLMVWDQSQGKPLTSPDDLVKAGLISRLPNAPPGMRFSYTPNKRLIELTPAR